MPLRAEYSWTEKLDQLILVVPLKGVSAKKVDIFGETLPPDALCSLS